MKFRCPIQLKKFLGSLIFLMAASSIVAAEAPMTALQILDKVAEKYKSCQSFSAEAQSSDISNIKTAFNYQTEKSAKFWFMRPELLRVDWTSKMSFNPKTQNYAIFVRKGQVYTFEDYGVGPKTYTKQDSVEMAMAAHTGISAGLTNQVPSLLLGKNYYKVQSWTLGPDLLIDGQACFNLNSISRSAGIRKSQWAVSKTSLELLQTRESTQMSAEEVKKMMTDAEKMSGTKFDFVKEYPAIDNETTTRYKNIVWNPGLKESDFDYALPADAKLVTDAEKRKITDELLKNAKKMMGGKADVPTRPKSTATATLKLNGFSSPPSDVMFISSGTEAQSNARLNPDGTIAFDFNSGTGWGCQLGIDIDLDKNGGKVLDVRNAKSLEFDVNLPVGTSFRVGLGESGSGPLDQASFDGQEGADGEDYLSKEYKAKGGWEHIRYDFSEATVFPYWGNQHGNHNLDLQALNGLAFSIAGKQGKGTLQLRHIEFSNHGVGAPKAKDTDLVHWMTEDEALKLSKATGKPLLYDFMAAWCGPCKMMAKQVFSDPANAGWINQNFLAVRIQDQRREQGTNPLRTTTLQQKYGLEGFPTLVVDLPGKSAFSNSKWKKSVGYGGVEGTRKFLEEALSKLKDGK